MTNEEFKNLKVGENFICGNKKFWVSERGADGCDYCGFDELGYITCYEIRKLGIIPECESSFREDGKDVVFVEVDNEN
jgi:hypothetical protein